MTVLRQWTKEEYLKMVEAGVLSEGERVELIEGSIVQITPANPPHDYLVTRLTMALTRAYGDTHAVRVQVTLDAGERSLPEPDFSLIRHERLSPERYGSEPDLVIEVSDSSLRYDREQKGSLYAKAGVPEYWIVNWRDRVVEVYRSPAADPDAPYGFAYTERSSTGTEGTVQPAFVPGAAVPVASFF